MHVKVRVSAFPTYPSAPQKTIQITIQRTIQKKRIKLTPLQLKVLLKTALHTDMMIKINYIEYYTKEAVEPVPPVHSNSCSIKT